MPDYEEKPVEPVARIMSMADLANTPLTMFPLSDLKHLKHGTMLYPDTEEARRYEFMVKGHTGWMPCSRDDYFQIRGAGVKLVMTRIVIEVQAAK
jgi:hypothetical protein